MPYGLLTTGFVEKPLATIMAELEAAQRASPALGDDWDTSTESPTGQLNGTFAAQLASAWEAVGVVYRSRDPRFGSFAGLDAVCSLTGTERRAASKGTVTLSVTLNAGVTLPAGSIAHVAGQPSNRWVTLASATNSGGSPATVSVNAEAEVAGVSVANSGTITGIATPRTGWTGVTNNADAAPGSAGELDAALRVRRERELVTDGGPQVDAIRAALLAVTGVAMVEVVENDTDDDLRPWGGIPPHAVEAIVQGGLDADVALALWKAKAGGIRAWGTTTTSVTSASGATRSVSFTRPTATNAYACVQVAWDDGLFPGGTAIEDAVAAVTASQIAGAPIKRSDVFAAVRAVAGVTDCAEVLLSRSVVNSVSAAARAAFAYNLTATPREALKLASGRVAVVRAR